MNAHWARRPDRRRRGEAGSATVFVVGFALVLLFVAGLAIDGGLAINKRMRVADDAEQAARAGANSIDIDQLRAGQGIVVDQQGARAKIQGFLQHDYGPGKGSWVVSFPNGGVRVAITTTSKPLILNFFGVKFPVGANATAVPATGP